MHGLRRRKDTRHGTGLCPYQRGASERAGYRHALREQNRAQLFHTPEKRRFSRHRLRACLGNRGVHRPGKSCGKGCGKGETICGFDVENGEDGWKEQDEIFSILRRWIDGRNAPVGPVGGQGDESVFAVTIVIVPDPDFPLKEAFIVALPALSWPMTRPARTSSISAMLRSDVSQYAVSVRSCVVPSE